MTHDELKNKFARRQFVANMGDRFVFAEPTRSESGVEKYNSTVPKLTQKMAETQLKKSTIRGLESVAWSSDSAADLLDYIRIRTGRDVRRREWASNNIGIELAQLLEDLRAEAANYLGAPDDSNAIRELHLELCREFIKHLVAYFEFEMSGIKSERSEE